MKHFLRSAFFALAILAACQAMADSGTVRVVVHKKTFPQNETGPLPVSVLDQASAAGYSLLADYATMAVFKGPSATASRLLSTIRAGGRDAEAAPDLERFSYHDVIMDAGTGPVPAATARQVYFLTLQSYAKYAWLQEFSNRGVRVLQALPPLGRRL